jgi:hypothetical protein
MFQVISLFIGAVLFLKAITALLFSGRFYDWRKQQYASTSIPPVVLVMPTLFVLLAGIAWYATLFHYQSWGWVVTGFTTLVAILGILNLNRWSTHRQKTGQAIEKQPGTRTGVDIMLLILGGIFAALGIFVY